MTVNVKEGSAKRVARVERGRAVHWVGDGFPVRTLLSHAGGAEAVSPFLLLDYAAPHEFEPTERRRGVGMHPHRGFETVTIAYQGEVEHRDSSGATGTIGPGDVQWMTAASGVLHEELHGRDFARRGGTFEMVQLWVNLPARLKMSPPAYQELRAERIPSVALPDDAGSARVVAGRLGDTPGPARTFTPVNVHDLCLRAGRETTLRLPEGHVAALLVRRGRVRLNETESVASAELALMDRRGDSLRVRVEEESTALLLTGEPLDEPVVGYGPFVMNTEREIQRALADFRSGKIAERAGR